MKRLFPDTDQQMAQGGTSCRKRPSDVNPTHSLCLGLGDREVEEPRQKRCSGGQRSKWGPAGAADPTGCGASGGSWGEKV